MEKLKLSALDLQRDYGVKKTTAYSWVNSGKFETVQIGSIKKILLTQEELEELTGISNTEIVHVQNGTVQKSSGQVQDKNNTNELELIKNMFDFIKDTVSSDKDQIKLLEDSEHRTKIEYFELKYNHERLKEDYKSLQTEKIELSRKVQPVQIILILVLIVVISAGVWLFVKFYEPVKNWNALSPATKETLIQNIQKYTKP